MFFDVKMQESMYAWCFYRSKWINYDGANAFRGFEARRKVWFMFLEANTKMARGGQFDHPPPSLHGPCVFSKNWSSKGKPWFSVTFNVIIKHIFPENFIDIPHVIQKICRIFLSILAIVIDFSDFLTFPCYKETNDVSL